MVEEECLLLLSFSCQHDQDHLQAQHLCKTSRTCVYILPTTWLTRNIIFSRIIYIWVIWIQWTRNKHTLYIYIYIPWKDEERVWYVRKHVDKSLMVLPIGIWYIGYLNIVFTSTKVRKEAQTLFILPPKFQINQRREHYQDSAISIRRASSDMGAQKRTVMYALPSYCHPTSRWKVYTSQRH